MLGMGLHAVVATMLLAAGLADHWQQEYEPAAAKEAHVIALWQFSAGAELEDSSAGGHTLRLAGAELVADGKFGGGLRSFPGWPVQDKRHAALTKPHPSLSPAGAFTIDLWLKPAADVPDRGNSYLLCKKYVSHNDYQLMLAPAGGKRRALHLSLGFGADSELFQSDSAEWPADVWQHIAVTYDGAGDVRFYRNGESFGGRTAAGRRAISPGPLPLSIGDRSGSNYGGFSGVLDQIRISNGVREFGAASLSLSAPRTALLRGEGATPVTISVRNLQAVPLQDARVDVTGIGPAHSYDLPQLAGGATHEIELPLDTMLRPDQYELRARLSVSGPLPTRREASLRLHLAPRPLPHRMPVVMWGIGGPGTFHDELPRLQDLGFTHCLGFGADYSGIWKAKEPIAPASPERMAAIREMLDSALASQFGIAANLSPGHFLKQREELQRVDREGKPYARRDANAALPGLAEFCEHVGTSVATAFGDHPAFAAALVNTEVRDASQVSFSESDAQAYRKFSGGEIPEEIKIKNGVSWRELPDFPEDRVIADDHPILAYYRWFWTVGDGWNSLHSAVHRGLKSTGREDLWTWYDPAIRAASIAGSGGSVDVLGQWTYTEPSPLRVGYFADELLAMAAAAPHQPRVMKMTQLFWYRSSSAPLKPGSTHVANPFDDHDPDAAYISISPMHLRQSFWTKLSRPVAGLMYHGWSSLVKTDGTHAYKHTHPDTEHEFRRLHREVLQPLGPMLLQIPEGTSDVAYLNSFTSQMFARRGSYGYSHDEAYLTLLHAQLQPQVIFEETLLGQGLDRYRVLVLVDCDVLTRSVVDKILAFQAGGGLIIGDPNLAPAITPDIVIPRFTRTKRAADDKATLLAGAAKLRQQLDSRYRRAVESSTPEIVPRLRRAGTSDYIFIVNDQREAGTYVGQHGLVQEQGVATAGALSLRRTGGHVYDLVQQREVPTRAVGDSLRWRIELGPSDGNIYLATDRAIEQVIVAVPDQASLGETMEITVTIADASGQAIDAVIPLQVEILDPNGRAAEFSGYYGAEQGTLTLKLDLATNDTPGTWTVRAKELVSAKQATRYFRVAAGTQIPASARD